MFKSYQKAYAYLGYGDCTVYETFPPRKLPKLIHYDYGYGVRVSFKLSAMVRSVQEIEKNLKP